MAAILALAIALWAVVAPTITVEFFQNDIGTLAQTGCPEANRCIIGVYEPGWNRLSEADRLSLMLHEVGHTLGLGHYRSCNYQQSIMGCWNLGEITAYDRAMLKPYRVVVPMVGQ